MLHISFCIFLGDTIFYKFSCESGCSDTHWGFKFTVTAGTRDSFETGYIILTFFSIFQVTQYFTSLVVRVAVLTLTGASSLQSLLGQGTALKPDISY